MGGYLAFRGSRKPQSAQTASKSWFPESSSPAGKSTAESGQPTPANEDNQPPAYWVRILKEGDPDRAEHARERLVHAGALAVPELRRLVRDPDAAVRLAALAALGEIGLPASEAVGDVAAALTDPEASVRIGAARALSRMGKPARTALVALITATADPHPEVREAVGDTLRRFAPLVRSDLPAVSPLLTGGTAERRAVHASALRGLKPDAETAVLLFEPLLHDADKGIRLDAIATIGDAGKAARHIAVGKLFPLLDDADEAVRAAALSALTRLGPPTANELKLLEAGLRGRAVEARRYCAEALAALGPAAVQAAPFLARALRDSDPAVRSAALTALGKMGKAILDVIEDVVALRSDPDPAVRKAVLKACQPVGRKPAAFATLVGGLSDADEGVRAVAMEALRGLDPPIDREDVLIFNTALKSKKPDVRRYAAIELERLGPDAQPVLATLLDAMKDRDPEVRKAVIGALGAIGPKAKLAVPELLGEMTAALEAGQKDPAAPERFRRAAVALAKVGEASQGMPLLRLGLKTTDPKLRLEVLAAVATLGPVAKPLLADLYDLFRDPESCDAAAAALTKIGKAAVPWLIRVLDRESSEAKLAAIKALEQMRPEDAREAVAPLYGLTRGNKDSDVNAAARDALKKINPPKSK